MSFAELKNELIEKISKKYLKQIDKLQRDNKKLKDALKAIKKQAKK